MRVANLDGRLVLVRIDGDATRAVDVERSSDFQFSADPQAIYGRWDEFREWSTGASWRDEARFNLADLRSPVPAPRQVFAVGLNYGAHARESGFEVPDGEPPVFTKFPSSITGPYAQITLPPNGRTDWEVELVVVIGRRAFQTDASAAMSSVAGYAVGQDLSERVHQMAASPPQFSLAKSFPGFSPIGPWIVTTDELPDPHDLEIGCRLDGEQVQLARTSEMVFSVPALVSKISRSTVLLPGDIIFTGTPAGVGVGRKPPRWIAPGNELVSYIDGVGQMSHTFVADDE